MKYSKAIISFSENNKEFITLYYRYNLFYKHKLYSKNEYKKMNIIRRISCVLDIDFRDLIHIIRKDN